MPTTLIRGGLVHDAVHRDACKADILLADGKIAAIGTDLNSTPFVRQYGILSNTWGVLLCQKEYQTHDIRQNSKSW